LLTKEPSTAFELALLYYILATRKTAGDKIAEASHKSIYWLKKAGVEFTDQIQKLIEIERLLVKHKYLVHRSPQGVGGQARHGGQVGARFYPQFAYCG
jgi:hypothetical protein